MHLSEVDWGDSSFFLYLKYIEHDESQRTSSPKDCGEDYHIEHLPPLMEYLKDSLDTGQTEGGFFNFKSIKEYRGSYSLPDPEHLESR